MLLIYELANGLYVGARLTVTVDAYDSMVDELVEGGMDEGEARARLLDEAEWAPDMEGVSLITGQLLCLQCRRPLPQTYERFCSVLCEASFYAEARG